MTNTTTLNSRSISFSLVLLLSLVITGTAHADTLYRQLEVGMKGSDVAALQTFLATDITLYPQGLVTSYFGFLTKSAVANFQSRNGLPAVGRVGPATLPIINAQMNGTVTVSAESAPAIYGARADVSRNGAQIVWATNEAAKGVVYYSSSPLSTYENVNSVSVNGSLAMTDENFRGAQNVSITGLQASTIYYYMIYTTDQQGNVSVTWPSTFKTAN